MPTTKTPTKRAPRAVKAVPDVEPEAVETDEPTPEPEHRAANVRKITKRKAPSLLPKSERVLIFHGDDDTPYYAPLDPPLGALIEYRHAERRQGDDAILSLVVNLMGAEAWIALQDAEDDDVKAVSEELLKLLNEHEARQGNRQARREHSRSSRKS